MQASVKTGTPVMPRRQARSSRINPFKLAIDLGLTIMLLGLWSIPLTGLVVHEWLGVALIIAVLIHLLLNWSWIVATTTRFIRALRTQVRINYLLNLALFIDMTLVLASGLMISVVALPAIGLHGVPSMLLRFVHVLASDTLLVLVGLHLGMNWRWVVATIRRQLQLARHHNVSPPRPASPAPARSESQ